MGIIRAELREGVFIINLIWRLKEVEILMGIIIEIKDRDRVIIKIIIIIDKNYLNFIDKTIINIEHIINNITINHKITSLPINSIPNLTIDQIKITSLQITFNTITTPNQQDRTHKISSYWTQKQVVYKSKGIIHNIHNKMIIKIVAIIATTW